MLYIAKNKFKSWFGLKVLKLLQFNVAEIIENLKEWASHVVY